MGAMWCFLQEPKEEEVLPVRPNPWPLQHFLRMPVQVQCHMGVGARRYRVYRRGLQVRYQGPRG